MWGNVPPALKVTADSFDGGLLKHDLRYPNRIGIRMCRSFETPRQIPAVLSVPRKKKISFIFNRRKRFQKNILCHCWSSFFVSLAEI
jgi:hypothetical protein